MKTNIWFIYAQLLQDTEPSMNILAVTHPKTNICPESTIYMIPRAQTIKHKKMAKLILKKKRWSKLQSHLPSPIPLNQWRYNSLTTNCVKIRITVGMKQNSELIKLLASFNQRMQEQLFNVQIDRLSQLQKLCLPKYIIIQK